MNKIDDNEGSLGGKIVNDCDVLFENLFDKEGNNVLELNNEFFFLVGYEVKLLKGIEIVVV